MKKYIILIVPFITLFSLLSYSNNIFNFTISYGWDTVYELPGNSSFVYLSFPTENTGYVSMGRKMAKTTNRGDDWLLYDNTTIANIISLSFINDSTGFCITYAYGNPFRCYKTIDGGLNWNELHISDTINTFHKVYFVDSFYGYILSSGSVFKSSDGGSTWAKDQNPVLLSGFKNDIQFANQVVGYINGTLEIYRTIDQCETWSKLSFVPLFIDNYTGF
ncbi:MAG TPA: hypothetical protein DEH02_20710 [Bacteroidales bacterium]|nr:MAG: hypothetical protein A2X01_08010 [Bacteroidetes bacterium GWF2_35_48]HBX53489.1 hypothetical protein [Bacteroidales bacterium]